MITRLGMAPRLAGHSYHDFQHHWRTSHADAAGKIPNLLRYVQNHAVLRNDVPVLGFPGFDACSELDFASVELMNEGFNSEEYQVRVRADERAFVEKSRFSSILGERSVVIDQPRPKDGVKLMLFYRVHPRSTQNQLVDELASFDASSLTGEGVRRRELLIPLVSGQVFSGVRWIEIRIFNSVCNDFVSKFYLQGVERFSLVYCGVQTNSV